MRPPSGGVQRNNPAAAGVKIVKKDYLRPNGSRSTRHKDLMDKTNYEESLRARGIWPVAGVDEAGRGPLAGPVAAAAVILPTGADTEGIADSKQLTEKKREALFDKIYATGALVGIGIAEPEEIDSLNILRATHLAMARALEALPALPALALVDGLPVKGLPVEHEAIVKGDSLVKSIGAASIIAKVTRDRLMYALDEKYPEYGFARHKGYGTREHLEAIRKYGVLPCHRKSFEPVRSLLLQGALFPEL
ncbi:MAG: ribonuclease HII [Abditibacteriota bacterium]|nr:ribonuclease HII [Abditibacteriota bacterium]